MNKILLDKTKKLLLKNFGKYKPQFAIITGSGVKIFPDNKPLFEISYEKLPVYSKNHINSVIGHENKIKLYSINKKHILVFSGRKHLYQGVDIFNVTVNVKLSSLLGIKELIITNAAGGLNPSFQAGDLMLITGYIDLMQPTERGVLSALIQPPYMIKNNLIKKISTLSKKIKKGIYAGVIGPTYETYAEINLLKHLKASAVGMSTVPELITGESLGLNYAGISIISNMWDSKHRPSHKEVVRQVDLANKNLNDLIMRLL